ncbi:MAG: PEGA domain-containing protein [Deltaproteobacteria bacterium]
MGIPFYVSPDGNDQNQGTIDAPLATLHQARQAVRARIAAFKPGEEQDVDIHLAAGTHRLRVEREGYLPIERELPSTGRRETVRIELRERPE